MSRPSEVLGRLAELHGVATTYRDANGEQASVDAESVVGLLGALGISVRGDAGARRAVERERARRQSLVIEPVQVHRGTGSPTIEFASHQGLAGSAASIVVELEDGRSFEEPLKTLEACDAPRGRRAVRLSRRLPVGVHHMTLQGSGVGASSTLLCAPRRLPAATRAWGAFLPLYAMRGEQDLGIGTFGDLAMLKKLLGSLGAGFLATLPLYPSYDEAPFDASPYLPVSRLAWNELYLDLVELTGREGGEEASILLASLTSEERRREAMNSREVDYEALSTRRRPLLSQLAIDAARDPRRSEELSAFFAERPLLSEYCEFRAARDAAAGATSLLDPPADHLEQALRYHRYVQFATARQLAAASGSGVPLVLDLPVGVHPYGFDVSRFASSFAFGASVGAPPDAFQPIGQNWGFPPLHPERQREDGYRYLRACLSTTFEHAAGLRIDHVMGLERLWWIPDGAAATEGGYVYGHLEELRALVAIEAHRRSAVVIGEDLGTVSDAIARAMDEEKMLHSSVLQFLFRASGPLPRLSRQSLASIGTHDLPKFAAFWRGLDLDDRAHRGEITQEEHEALRIERDKLCSHVEALLDTSSDKHGEQAVLEALLRYLGESSATFALVDLEDCWLETEPTNRPGTLSSGGNWRRRSARTLEEMARDEFVLALPEVLGATRSVEVPA